VVERDAYALGFEQVDGDEHVAVLLRTMDSTASWSATRELRAFEQQELRLVDGDRLLDVGCGLGDAALDFAEDLRLTGEVVGIDKSAEMLNVARERAPAARCSTRFAVGDALALDEPDESFDAVRSERTLQWLADPQVAVDGMTRVLRPGGRLSLIDTDWSTFRLDVGDPTVTSAVERAMRVERRRPSNVGRRLGDLARSAGWTSLITAISTQSWTSWDPDASPAPDGCSSMQSLARDLVDAGELDRDCIDRFIAVVHDAARSDRFVMSLTMFA